MDPSVARNTLRLSTRHWAQFFSGRPGHGLSPPAVVPNITRRVSRSSCVRCTAPAKETPLADGRLNALALCLLKYTWYIHIDEVMYKPVARDRRISHLRCLHFMKQRHTQCSMIPFGIPLSRHSRRILPLVTRQYVRTSTRHFDLCIRAQNLTGGGSRGFLTLTSNFWIEIMVSYVPRTCIPKKCWLPIS